MIDVTWEMKRAGATAIQIHRYEIGELKATKCFEAMMAVFEKYNPPVREPECVDPEDVRQTVLDEVTARIPMLAHQISTRVLERMLATALPPKVTWVMSPEQALREQLRLKFENDDAALAHPTPITGDQTDD